MKNKLSSSEANVPTRGRMSNESRWRDCSFSQSYDIGRYRSLMNNSSIKSFVSHCTLATAWPTLTIVYTKACPPVLNLCWSTSRHRVQKPRQQWEGTLVGVDRPFIAYYCHPLRRRWYWRAGQHSKMASPMEAMNATQTSFPDAIHATIASSQTGILSKALDGTSLFGILAALFVVAVTYDQGMCCVSRPVLA